MSELVSQIVSAVAVVAMSGISYVIFTVKHVGVRKRSSVAPAPDLVSDAWRHAAEWIDGTYEASSSNKGRFPRSMRIEGVYDGQPIVVQTYMRGDDEGTCATAAALDIPSWFRLTVLRRSPTLAAPSVAQGDHVVDLPAELDALFVVHANDDAAARDLFKPTLLDALAKAPDVGLSLADGVVEATCSGVMDSAADILAMLHACAALARSSVTSAMPHAGSQAYRV